MHQEEDAQVQCRGVKILAQGLNSELLDIGCQSQLFMGLLINKINVFFNQLISILNFLE